jgi:flagellar hook-basal body complex protein FliE
MSLAVSSISLVTPVAPAAAAASAADVGKPGEFASLFQNAVAKVDGYRTQADRSINQLLTGEGGELHNVALAAQQAELAFELGLQVRNKVVSAYQEIMRMQV